ncbi:DbpA RNA binding domain-containing protein [Treponema parvum]|uniref:DbpA RNA binding domain-containing protein n=1 Tax=Treponema parvum TaxID=138851 RepID=A0A975ICY6_9SPIR|nr:DbpA RNA binding domain-containing protein [Treponema parvum]QTQ12405.1 DbpA RNA binding domain-containing protein [Treponema parvum]
MSFKHADEIDINLFVSILNDAVSKVKTEEDPEVLTDLKKIYKKNVPFSLRTYVAAYLAKLAMGSRSSSYKSRRDGHEGRAYSRDWKSRPARETRNFQAKNSSVEEKESEARTPRVQIDSDLATTIFIGIGRNRRVYPRDLVGLLISAAHLDRDRIGDIRVLANYSFIQLFNEDADKVIEALNGYDYRGRKLTVSYSHQKDVNDAVRLAESEHPENFSSEVNENDKFSQEDAEAYAAAEKAAADKEPFTTSSAL